MGVTTCLKEWARCHIHAIPRARCARRVGLVWRRTGPLAGEETVGAYLGEGLLGRGLVAAVQDAGLELAEGLDGQDGAGVVFGLNEVDERHLVVQLEGGVPEAVGAGPVEFGVDGADKFGVGGGLVGLGPVTDEALLHGYLLVSIFGASFWTGTGGVAGVGRRLGMTRPDAAPSRARPAQAPIAGPKPATNVAGEA